MRSRRSGNLFLYSSLVLPIDRRCASVAFKRVGCRKKPHFATVLITCVANRPTLRVNQFVTRVLTRRVGLCTVLSTCVANRRTLRVGSFATGVLRREAVLCYCTVHTCRKLTNAARRSIWNMSVYAQSRFVYCTVHECCKSTDAARRSLCYTCIETRGGIVLLYSSLETTVRECSNIYWRQPCLRSTEVCHKI